MPVIIPFRTRTDKDRIGMIFTRIGSSAVTLIGGMKPPKGVILLIPSAREFDRGLRRGIFEYAHAHGALEFL